MTFSGGEDSNCVLNGFTITEGLAEKGGGIYAVGSPRIMNCVITGNTATTDGSATYLGGGGIFCDQNSPLITDCVIRDNMTVFDNSMFSGGGGIFAFLGLLLIIIKIETK